MIENLLALNKRFKCHIYVMQAEEKTMPIYIYIYLILVML